MSPWLPLISFVAVLNLLAFVIVRDRWGPITLLLLVAAIGGAAIGDLVGARTGLELLRVGDVHVLSASIGAQLAMIGVLLLAALGPNRSPEPGPPRRARSAGQRRPRTPRPPAVEEEEAPRIAGRGARER
jgi:hypothetical protein